MTNGTLDTILETMDPEEALASLSMALKQRLVLLDAEERLEFLLRIFDASSEDKLASMVNR